MFIHSGEHWFFRLKSRIFDLILRDLFLVSRMLWVFRVGAHPFPRYEPPLELGGPMGRLPW